MTKEEVAEILDEIATFLELQGEDSFRANAYRNGSRAIANLSGDLEEIVRKDQLKGVPGIGPRLREQITTLVTTGRLPFYDELKASIPEGALQMLRLPGIGPKKVRALQQAGISDLSQLEAACRSGRVAALKGFGEKTQQKILEGLAFLGEVGNRVRIDQASRVADEVIGAVRRIRGVQRAEVAGSLRRRRETAKDIDIVCSSAEPAAVIQAFVSLPQVRQVVAQGETRCSVVLEQKVDGQRVVLNSDLRVVTEEQFVAALIYFTGSKEFNIKLRRRALARGWSLNEYELHDGHKPIPLNTEKDLFAALDLDEIPPELREDTGEIECADRLVKPRCHLPKLIARDDIRGVFHNHTNYSDGSASLEEMAQAAQDLGFEYLGIADHSQSLTVARGLSPDRVWEQFAAIDALNKKFRGFRLFKGTEVDILPDGTLDYPDDLLAAFDYVVASVHTHFGQTEEEMTERICRAVRHPLVTMLGHATGRLLLRREGYRVNLDRVLEAAAESGTMIEINAQPSRLELDWRYCKRAKELGIPLVINPDAHSTGELAFYVYGVDVARRGWLEAKDVFNTLSLKQVLARWKKR
jgi:DNA polymerase (family 10)